MNNYFKIIYTALILVLSSPVISQVQVGADLDGEAPGDQFGISVSLSDDGTRLAAGTSFNSANGGSAGHVRIFDWDGSAWVQLGTDIDGVMTDDQFGASVFLSADGSRLAVGAIGNSDNGVFAGQVRVYRWDGGNWVQLGSSIDGEAANDQFGRSISMSADGNRLASGSRQNGGNGLISGHVRVYEWDGNDWSQLGLDIDGAETGDQSGSAASLSADGMRLAIGATFNNGNGGNAGHARVFEWDGMNWTQLGASINGEAASNFSGWSVSLSADGSRLAVGAPANDGNGEDSGHVRVYDWDGMEWVQVGTDIDGEAAGDRSGGSVFLSDNGNLLAIGATENGGNGQISGHTRIYRWDGVEWTQLGIDIDGEAPGDRAGFAVSLSADGSRIAVGAIANDGNGEDSGQVRVFENIISATNNAFGTDISISPNPARDEVYLSDEDIDRLQIFDFMGKLIIDEKRPGQSFNISKVPTGVYFVKISIDQMIYSLRLVKQ